MKSPDQLWRQLLAAARLAPARPLPEPSWTFTERALSRWRAEHGEETASVEIMAWMGRRVLVSAVLITMATLAFSYLPWEDTWTALSGSAPWLEVVADL
jgi:hypothetical protein